MGGSPSAAACHARAAAVVRARDAAEDGVQECDGKARPGPGAPRGRWRRHGGRSQESRRAGGGSGGGSQGGCGMEASAAGEEEAEEAATVVPVGPYLVGPTSPCKEEGSMLIVHKYTTLGKKFRNMVQYIKCKETIRKVQEGV